MDPEIDPRVHTWLDEDEVHVDPEELKALWGTLEPALEPGVRDTLVSQPTSVRLIAGLIGTVFVGITAVMLQGLRRDLTLEGWATFAAIGGALMLMGVFTALWPLRSRAAPPGPLWPWIPATWITLLAFTTLAPWPGVTGVPSSMHLWCFGATCAAGLAATAWLALWERSVSPVPQRIGLIASGAGIAAFVFQSLFCPGVDLAHLLIGHAAPTLGIGLVIIGLALMLRK